MTKNSLLSPANNIQKYRKDIDGLRSIAVFSVIFYHFGYFSQGFLGVDIFFVISGYLITGIVYSEIGAGKFSITNFYLRRIRRIIPLTLSTSIVALIIGLLVMLPDDLENLAQSIVATNLFSNNILQLITTHNYWAVVNEYKPLMHTWSLGIEEQFYLFYPFIFLIFSKGKEKTGFYILSILATLSLSLYLFSDITAKSFYLIQFRFFELAAGGIIAIILNKRTLQIKYFNEFLLLILIALLFFGYALDPKVTLCLTVIVSCGLIAAPPASCGKISKLLIENKLIVGIGKISFSLYMWHQIVMAYARYFIVEEITMLNSMVMLLIIFALSIASYFIIERPFRDKKLINTKILLWTTGSISLVLTAVALWLYGIGGVVRDVPELGVEKTFELVNLKGDVSHNVHSEYNARIYKLNKPFETDENLKILIIGNSFARDWANVLLESPFAAQLDISYVPGINMAEQLSERKDIADRIFIAYDKNIGPDLSKYGIDVNKTWIVGIKNFGFNNGIVYNRKGGGYFQQRVRVDPMYQDLDNAGKAQWGNKYIDIIGTMIDKQNKVPVFTENKMFISQDCTHLTQPGAQFVENLLEDKIKEIITSSKRPSLLN